LVAAALLKVWGRSMSQPIIPFELFPRMIELGRRAATRGAGGGFDVQHNASDRIAMHAITATLPAPSAKTLLTLLLFLNRLWRNATIGASPAAATEELTSLGESFAPVLVRCADIVATGASTTGPSGADMELLERPSAAKFVEALLRAPHECFMTGGYQARTVHDSAEQVMTFLFPDQEEQATVAAAVPAPAQNVHVPVDAPVAVPDVAAQAAPIASAPAAVAVGPSGLEMVAEDGSGDDGGEGNEEEDDDATSKPKSAADTAAARPKGLATMTALSTMKGSLVRARASVAASVGAPAPWQPDSTLPREEQLRLLELHLLEDACRGGAVTHYAADSGTQTRGITLAYRVAAAVPGNPPKPPSSLDPLSAVENRFGGLYWGPSGEFASASTGAGLQCVRLLDIKKLIDGKLESATWTKGDARAKSLAPCCFTVVHKGGTLDLEASSPRAKLEWIYAIRVLMGAIGRGPKATVAPLLKPPQALVQSQAVPSQQQLAAPAAASPTAAAASDEAAAPAAVSSSPSITKPAAGTAASSPSLKPAAPATAAGTAVPAKGGLLPLAGKAKAAAAAGGASATGATPSAPSTTTSALAPTASTSTVASSPAAVAPAVAAAAVPAKGGLLPLAGKAKAAATAAAASDGSPASLAPATAVATPAPTPAAAAAAISVPAAAVPVAAASPSASPARGALLPLAGKAKAAATAQGVTPAATPTAAVAAGASTTAAAPAPARGALLPLAGKAKAAAEAAPQAASPASSPAVAATPAPAAATAAPAPAAAAGGARNLPPLPSAASLRKNSGATGSPAARPVGR
jgi:hypothetical protein